MILVSACLVGVRCCYDARRCEIPEEVRNALKEGLCLVPVCPEQLGGLPTPRSENLLSWDGDKPTVIDEDGRDVTPEFLSGAEETLKIARLVGAKRAVFKSRSPSCGEDGVTTRLLREEGIEVKVIDAAREEGGKT